MSLYLGTHLVPVDDSLMGNRDNMVSDSNISSKLHFSYLFQSFVNDI